MSSFGDLIQVKAIAYALLQRDTALFAMKERVHKINDLSSDSPNPRIFGKVEQEANEELSTLKGANRNLVSLLLNSNRDIKSDSAFQVDQKNVRSEEFKCMNAIDNYIQLFADKNITYPVDSKPNSDPSDLDTITKVLKSQSETTVKVVDKMLKEFSHKDNSAAPRPSQPFFTSKQTEADFAAFKEFLKKFEHFTSKCISKTAKLEWLQSSVKGEAYLLIGNLTLEDDNYDIAVKSLKDKYLDPDTVKHTLLQSILNFNCEAGARYAKLDSAVVALLNNLNELKTVHSLDIGEELCKELLRELVFYKLPAEVGLGLVDACGTNYPSFTDIVAKLQQVIKKLNLGKDLSSKKQNSPHPKSDNPGSGNQKDSGNPGSGNHKGKQTFSENVVHQGLKAQSGKKSKWKSGKKGYKCVFCQSGEHSSSKCTAVSSVEARTKFLKRVRNDPCPACMKKHSDACDPKYFCQDASCVAANGQHAYLLCPRIIAALVQPQTIAQVARFPLSANVNNTARKDQKAVALPTAVMTAFNPAALRLPLEQRNVSVMADTGGQRTLITKAAATRLGLDVIGSERACLQGFGTKGGSNHKFDIVSIKLGMVGNENPVTLDAFVVPSLNPLHMAGAAKIAKKLALKGVTLADWRLLDSKSDIVSFDVLVGSDFYYKIVSPQKLPKQISGMWLLYTWSGQAMLIGKIPGSAIDKQNQNVNYITIQNISCQPEGELNLSQYVRPGKPVLDENEIVHESNAFNIVRELNNFDAMGIQVATRDEEDKEALSAFKSNMVKDEVNNQYIVGFPWVNDTPPTQDELDSNYYLVLNMFKHTMKTLDKDRDKLLQYAQTHEKEIANDFIEKIPIDQLRDNRVVKHFIQHFPVWKQESATTKCRRVFNASLHKRGKACLNDKLLKGSQLTPHILKVMMRVRLLEYLLSTDISKAFLRMVLKMSDRNYTCFFARDNWFDPESPISVWRFKSVLFGATSSPFLLNCTVADILVSNEFGYLLEVFVDNLFVCLDNSKDIITAADSLADIFNKSSMPLHEFASNCPVTNNILKNRGLKTKESKLKVLGMMWDFTNDLMYINEPVFEVEHVTKRSLLSDIAKVFDPIGFLGPLTALGRQLVQVAWECDFNWDTALTSDIVEKWVQVVSQLKAAIRVPIPRWVGLKNLNNVSVHCFTDASDKALGVVIYLVNAEHSVFFSSKPKVCPIKMAHFTVPRKELAAFALGVKHLIFVLDAISKYCTPASLHVWSDSTLALTWCSAKKVHKELFIRARVDDVQHKLSKHNIQMHYILNNNNPADMLTKDTERSLSDPLWQCGPQILGHPERWHIYTPTKANVDAIPIFCGHTVTNRDRPDGLPDPLGFDSLVDLLSATSKVVPNKDNLPEDKMLVITEKHWLKKLQELHYPDLIQFLEQLKGHNTRSLEGKKIIRNLKLIVPSSCSNLHMVLDKDGIIRVRTSLSNCPNLTYDQKYPILLPAKDSFTNLVIKHSHNLAGHMGLHHTRAHLRRRFWVPKDTSVISLVVRKCPSCNAQRGQRYHVPDSPDLPEYRFDVQQPWNVTYLDMTGHMYIKDRYNNAEKVYFIVFVCASTGSGHIEMAVDASSQAFANAFERFCARRGVPSQIVSDQGSNFKGYHAELIKISKELTVNKFVSTIGISWKWTPIGDPHFNGYCERHLGILKSIMKKAVKNRLLTLDQLHTVACYAETLFNERPLYISDANDPDCVPITPNYLVYGRSLRHFAHGNGDSDPGDPEFRMSTKSCEVMHKKLRSTLAAVRKTWLNEYLVFLARRDEARQKRSPHTKSIIVPRVDDWVLIKDGSKDFRIGRIVSLIESGDGEIRCVNVKTQASEGVYPVTNIRFLEFHENPSGVIPAAQLCNSKGSLRPKRLAATKAEINIAKCL